MGGMGIMGGMGLIQNPPAPFKKGGVIIKNGE